MWLDCRPSPFGAGMKRREFIIIVGGATMWPLAAQGQQPTGTRRIGVLMNFRSDVAEGKARVAAFMQALQKLGWNEGDNVRIDIRWAADDIELYRKHSQELVELNPNVILASASQGVTALQRITRSVPIVFANVADPVGAGYVASLARPGGNTTGFTAFEYSIGGKWLELLKKMAPHVTRIAAKYELVINLKVAKALGLAIPAALLATADEVIE